MMDGMMAGMGLWELLAVVTVLAMLVLAVLGSVWLVRQLRRPERGSPPTGDTARDLLRRRYAAGELDDDEYERRLSALNRH